jgi:hypothetical protein
LFKFVALIGGAELLTHVVFVYAMIIPFLLCRLFEIVSTLN